MKLDKQRIFEELKKKVEKKISVTEKAFNNALRGFKDAPGFMESASDTTRAEKDRLMGIYKQKLKELKKGLLDLGKLVSINSDIIKEGYLGQALMNKRQGDIVEFKDKFKIVEVE